MKKLLKIKSIYLKFVLLFIGVLWLSSIIAFSIIFTTSARSIQTAIDDQLAAKAASVKAYCAKSGQSVESLIDVIGDAYIKIEIYTPEQLKENGLITINDELKAGKVITGRLRGHSLIFSAVMIQGKIVVLQPDFKNNLVEFMKGSISSVLLLCASVGSILIVILVRMIIKPVKRLSAATKEVAKGNFNIELVTKSLDEVGQLTRDFNTMVLELRSIECLRKDFVSAVSHEYKTPITAIGGFAKLIRDRKLTDEQHYEYTDVIVKETERLSNLSANLLRLSELDSQVIRESATTFSLDEQIRKVVLMLESEWSAKNLELDIELDTISYHGDEQLLQQVWFNLIGNAVKFSHDSGTLKINLHKTGTVIRVSIYDNGLGIADEDKPRIFERFYKGDKSRSKDGNGLGLAIVKKIIDLSGGHVYVESEPGKGTTFTVELISDLHI